MAAWVVWAALLAWPDTPPLTDAWRFPNEAACRHALHANAVLQQNLKARICYLNDFELPVPDFLYLALDRNDQLRLVWEWALTAQGEWPGWTQTNGLKGLRNILGHEAYYAGRMPPAIPVDLLPWKD